MFGIVNPSLVSVNAIRKIRIANMMKNAITVDIATNGAIGIVQHFEKHVISVVKRITLEWYVDPVRDLSLNQVVIQGKGQIGPKEIENVHTDVVYMKFAEDDCHDDMVEDLTDQVQSLFYN